MNREAYIVKQTPNEKGRLVWVVYLPNGDIARHGAVYRGDHGRIRVFRSSDAAQQWADERAALFCK